MTHPLSIQPLANQALFGQQAPECRTPGLGALSCLKDELLLQVLQLLEARDLGRLAGASKALYCFANHEELWRALVLEQLPDDSFTAAPQPAAAGAANGNGSACCNGALQQAASNGIPGANGDASTANGDKPRKKRRLDPAGSADGASCSAAAAAASNGAAGGAAAANGDSSASYFTWRGDWRRTYLATHVSAAAAAAPRAKLAIAAFYSDLLYQPWLCATMGLQPEWLEADNIDRCSGLSREDFVARYELPNKPVVLTDAMDGWQALKKWDRAYLSQQFKGKKVIVGGYPLDFDAFCAYADDHCDDMPLYLFDRNFVAKAPQLGRDYSVPKYFADDLFSVLGDKRPDYRWLIYGSARSGSSFHIDPNSTSAWNGVVYGRKKWILYPPGCVPPGVHPSPDGADVATPVSLIEWFINFYDSTREGRVRPVECVCGPGELVFVPRGWWHLVLNLEESLAVTQNYVSAANLGAVLAFLRPGRADLVSGCTMEERGRLYDRFVAALREQRPAVLAAAEAAQQQAEAARKARWEQERKLSSLFGGGAPRCGGGSGYESNGGTAVAGEAAGAGAAAAAAMGDAAKPEPAKGFTFSFGFGS